MILLRTLWAGLAASLLLTSAAQAQAPANDLCSNAQALTSGAQVPGTTVGAADDLIGLPGCQNAAASVHPDVWYTITANAPQLDFVVTATGSVGANLEVLVYEGNCASALNLRGFECGTGTVVGGVGALTAGATYRVVVSSPDSASATSFNIKVTVSTPPILPSQDCNQATIVTSPATFSQGTINSGSGVVPNEVTTTNSCFGAQSGSNTNERQSKWFKFIAGTTGKLQFNINPVTANDDYDWAVWDVTGDPVGCTTKGNALACNWTGARGATGLSLCPNSEPGYQGGDQFDNKTTGQNGANGPIDIVAGRVYALLVDNFSTSNDGFTLLLGGQPTCTPPAGQAVGQIGLDANFNTFVECNAVVFTKTNVLTVNPGISYIWNFGDGTSSTNPTAVHVYQGSPSGPTTYVATLQITDIYGRQTIKSQQVTIDRVVVASVVPSVPTPICAGDSLTLTARGGSSYAWSPAIGLSSTVDSVVRAAPPVTTTYQVIVTSGACVDTTTYQVVVTQLPTTQATAALPNLCIGGSTTLTATGADAYEWSPATGLSATTGATVTAAPTQTTTYIVTGRNNNQCPVLDTVTITVVPVVPASGTISAVAGVEPFSTTFTSTVADATAWLWDFGDGQTSTEANPTHTYTAAGEYTVTLTATYGVADCQTPVTLIGKVQATAPIVYNIITPNGDGKNDTFSAVVSSLPIKLQVFNRWGREVYSADNYQQNWNGDDLPAGTYYYHLTTSNGKAWKGWLEIVR